MSNIKNSINSSKAKTISSGDHFHTETSFYIDDLYKKYKLFKFFKIRYLVRRNNRLSIGFKKHLIPTKRLLKALLEIYAVQDLLLSRLSVIIMDILNDESIDDPTCFNYLRIIRAWLIERPLSKQSYDAIRWMERANFEREFKSYLYNAFSFRRLSKETKERIIKQIEDKLPLMADLKKDDIFDSDSDSVKREKEKRNFECDRQMLSFLSLFRAFVYGADIGENILPDVLKTKYKVTSYDAFLMMIVETLIYQRPAQMEDVIYKFEIKTPEVSTVRWNYSEEYLKKVGKDALARNRKMLLYLHDKLGIYDTVYTLLNVRDRGMSVITRGVGFQWKQVDKSKNNPEEVLQSDFLTYVEGAVLFFSNMFVPLINGSRIVFKDKAKKEIVSSIFTDEFYSYEVTFLKRLINHFHDFRNENPTLILSKEESLKIMRKQIASMDHVEILLRNTGNCFYNIAKKLLPFYERHRRWVSAGGGHISEEILRTPLTSAFHNIEDESEKTDRPLPFADCIISAFTRPGRLSGGLEGKTLFDSVAGDGAIGFMMAYAYQMASLCQNAELSHDLDERTKIMRRIEDVNKDIK